jgi:hypothetical protein
MLLATAALPCWLLPGSASLSGRGLAVAAAVDFGPGPGSLQKSFEFWVTISPLNLNGRYSWRYWPAAVS